MRQGFSIIEAVLVIGLLAAVAGITLSEGIAPFRYEMARLHEEYEHARTDAVRGKALRYVCEGEECAATTPDDSRW